MAKYESEGKGFKALTQSSDKLRDKLPMDHMAENQELRIFFDLFLLTPIRDVSGTGKLAAVALDKDKKLELQINFEMFLNFPIKEQMFIIAHEGAHVVLAHLLRNKRISHHKVWNIATDGVLDTILMKHYRKWVDQPTGDDGSKIGITLELLHEQELIKEYDTQRSHEYTSEEVYTEILSNAKEGEDGDIPGDGEGKDREGQSPWGKLIDDLDNRRIDEHDPLFNADNIDDDIKEHIGGIIRSAKNGAYGTASGGMVQDIFKAAKKYFPFDKILDPIIHRKETDFSRPHRRLVVKPFVFPRKRGEEIKVYAAVDCSGSCADYIEEFVGYLMSLPETEEIYFFDTDINLTLKKGQPIPKAIPGWGGTDLNPAMAKFAEAERNCRGKKLNFVVLTDGEIPELHCGPVRSRTVIMTTHEKVHYSKAINPYININISPDEL